jgi:hypothetical protein
MSTQRILYVLAALAWVVAWLWLVANFDDLTALIGRVGPLGVTA